MSDEQIGELTRWLAARGVLQVTFIEQEFDVCFLYGNPDVKIIERHPVLRHALLYVWREYIERQTPSKEQSK